jgi:hypothetical protein
MCRLRQEISMSVQPVWSYPLHGFVYLFTHRSLCRPLCAFLLLLIGLSVTTTLLFLLFVFPAQATALSSFMASWLSYLLSLLLTLLEIGIVMMILSCLFVSCYMPTIFDAVCQRESTDVGPNAQYRPVESRHLSCLKSFAVLMLFRVCLAVVTSPLHLIPFVGTILYVFINGFYYAWSLHCRYFDSIGLTFAQGLLVIVPVTRTNNDQTVSF